jgi:L-asparaginase II/alkylhydroperoxidase/carboxymuconolactone decarboxylase family protein YurZ
VTGDHVGEVRLMRGGRVESVHRVHVALTDAEGRLLGVAGDAEREVFLRSAAKPFQAIPLVEDGAAQALDFDYAELALACGSHGGESDHVDQLLGTLRRLGLDETDLACGAHPPMHGPSACDLARAGEHPGRAHNNCSGKHAGMLALARFHGWPLEGYHEAGHPVQERMAAEVARWTGVNRTALGEGVDGCGVVCFSAPLRALARGYAALLEQAWTGEPGPGAVVGAMVEYPHYVAGTDRPCTALMEAGIGRVLAKVGAEGVYAAAIWIGPRGGDAPAAKDEPLGVASAVGVAIKVEDGSRRAAEVALVAVLDAVAEWGGGGGRSAVPDAVLDAAARWRRPEVPNTRGEAAAHLEAHLGLRFRGPAPRGALRPGMRALARVAAAQAARDLPALDRGLEGVAAAVEAGNLSDLEVEEALVQSYLFLGYPSALEALARWRRVRRRPAVGAVNEVPECWAERGPEVCNQVYGAQYAELRKNIAALHPDLDRWMVVEGYGKVLGRPGLPLRDRELLIAAVLAVQDAPRQLHSHLRGALRTGVTVAEVEELLDEIDPWFSDGGARNRARERWEEVRERALRPRPEAGSDPATEDPDTTEGESEDVH